MQTFTIAPAVTRVPWSLPIMLFLILVFVFGLIGRSLHAMRTAEFELSPAGLELRGDWYGRLIPRDQLVAGSATRVNFSASPELLPRWRTAGTALPGYQAGWFKLRNGEKALLYLTDRQRAVYVPTTAGYGVLLSPADPDAFVSALRSIGR